MNTAEKRKRFEELHPQMFETIYNEIEKDNYRYIDRVFNSGKYEKFVLEYVITLLCDELVERTNE